jgi:hypothetical protein
MSTSWDTAWVLISRLRKACVILFPHKVVLLERRIQRSNCVAGSRAPVKNKKEEVIKQEYMGSGAM